MKATASKRSNESSFGTTRKISELEPPTRRTGKGNYVEILGDFKPLGRDFAPSNAAKDNKKP